MWPFKKKTKIVIHNRPLPDEEALKLVDSGAIKPEEAPLAVLRRMAFEQNKK